MASAFVLGWVLAAWGTIHAVAGDYCVDQPRGVESFLGGSATLPCHFVYQKNGEPVTNVAIVWRAGNVNFCGEEIYNTTGNFTHKDYEGRLFMVGDPQLARDATITIKDLNTNDRKSYCCRVHITLNDGSSQQWQNGHGTRLSVRGDQALSIHQPPFIPALVGDSVTIPCNFSVMGGMEVSNLTGVEWSFGPNSACGGEIYNSTTRSTAQRHTGRISLVGEAAGNRTASIQIKQVKASDSGWYCCTVEVVTRDGKVYVTKRNDGTELIVKGPEKRVNIDQPEQSSAKAGTSSSINCSFTQPQDKDPLFVGVYWVFGIPRESFAYHPNTDLIHPNYKGRTRLMGQSNLLLEKVRGMDNTTYYCRVAIRLCASNPPTPNMIETILEEGSGTLLRVYAPPDQTLIIALAVGVMLIVLAALSLATFFIMRKIVSKKQQANTGQNALVTMEMPTAMEQDCENPDYFPRPQGEDILVYASLDHSHAAFSTKAGPETVPETVYAAVKLS